MSTIKSRADLALPSGRWGVSRMRLGGSLRATRNDFVLKWD